MTLSRVILRMVTSTSNAKYAASPKMQASRIAFDLAVQVLWLTPRSRALKITVTTGNEGKLINLAVGSTEP
jgi:hypothetical protein